MRVIRLPVHISELVNKYIRAVRSLTLQLMREPGDHEVAGKMRISLHNVRALSRHVKDVVSLDTPVGDQEEATLKDMLSDENAFSIVSSCDDGCRNKRIDEWISRLPATERRVIELRYGLNREDPQTLRSIGKHFGVTRERIRQIENQALDKLRSLARSRNIVLNDMLSTRNRF